MPKVVEARALFSGRQPATNCGSSAATLVVPPPTASPSQGGLALCTRLARTDYGRRRCLSLPRFRYRGPARLLFVRQAPAGTCWCERDQGIAIILPGEIDNLPVPGPPSRANREFAEARSRHDRICRLALTGIPCSWFRVRSLCFVCRCCACVGSERPV